MSLNFLNTVLRPANEVIFDVSLGAGSNLSLNLIPVSGVFKYQVNDEEPVYSNNSVVVSSDPSARNIRVYKASTSGGKAMQQMSCANYSIEGDLDLRKLTGATYYNLSNTDLSSIQFPTTHAKITAFYLQNMPNLSGTLDISGLTNLCSFIGFNGCSNLTQILFPDTSSAEDSIIQINGYNAGISGELDLSPLKKWSDNAIIQIYNNDISTIIFPDTSAHISNIRFGNNNLGGTIDISSLSGLRGVVDFGDNDNLNYVLFPETSAAWTQISIDRCDLQSLDLTMLTGPLPYLYLLNNSNFSSLLLADNSTDAFTTFNLNNCGFSSIDVSNRIFTNCSFYARYNPSLTSLTLPDASCWFRTFSFTNSPLSGELDVSNHYFTGTIDIGQTDITNFIFDSSKCTGLTYFYAQNSEVTQPLDFTYCKNIKALRVEQSNLTGITYPDDASGIDLRVSSTDVIPATGVLDVSNLETVRSLELRLTDASVVYWPYNQEVQDLWNFVADGCNFSGILDLSINNSITGSVNLYNNDNLKGIIFPDNPNTSYIYGGTFRVHDCSLEGHLDLSNLVISQYWQTYNNRELTSISMPYGYYANTYWYQANFRDCSLNQTTVDNILSDLADMFEGATTIYTNFTLALDGGGNAPPTDGSANVDISTLEYLFSQAGRTLTLTYNT